MKLRLVFAVTVCAVAAACGGGGSPDAGAMFSVGGVISGLHGQLILHDDLAGELTVSADGAFRMPGHVRDGSAYDVRVAVPPANQTCAVTGGAGTVLGHDVNTVSVVCSNLGFTVGGFVSGLTGSGLTLQNNLGDDLAVAQDGAFTFATPVASGDAYSVTVKTQPQNPSQTCSVSGGSGTIGAGPVGQVLVTCSVDLHTVGGTISGLTGTGLVLAMAGQFDLTPAPGATRFAFATMVASGTPYSVSVKTQSAGQTCTLLGESGTVGGSDVVVQVTCFAGAGHLIRGQLHGLAGHGLVLSTPGEPDLTLNAPAGIFTFANPLPDTTAYSVTVTTAPANPAELCVVDNGSGTINGADVQNIVVSCFQPDIDVTPSTVDFGRIAVFTGYPSAVTGKLTITNAGVAPQPPDVRGNLHLGMNGTGTMYWSVAAADANETAAELCVGGWNAVTGACLGTLPAGSYDPVVGLPALGSAATFDLPLIVLPANASSAGIPKEWLLTIYSNDPDEPSVVVHVKANAVIYPVCNYTLAPASLSYGLLAPPRVADLGFQIVNNSTTDTCLVSKAELAAGSDPAFSLKDGPVTDTEILPGATLTIPVRAAPQTAVTLTQTSITGAVALTISNPTTPNPTVALSGTVAQACLSIVPSSVDFGTAAQNCSTATRTFTIYNSCTTSVQVQSSAITSGTEFSAVSTAAIAPGTYLAAGSTATFSLKYHPSNLGADVSSFDLKVTQLGVTTDYVVPLKGAGDTSGSNADTFTQPAKPKADVLLVLDNSCSMYDKQLAFSTNVASFLQYAAVAGVDYHLGVVTTDMDDFTQMGRLQADAGTSLVLDTSSPNVAGVLADRILYVGLAGSGVEQHFEPALAALSSPLVTSTNAGFLRTDASLGIVSFSDADDQSSRPVTWYADNLLNLKNPQPSSAFSFSAFAPLLATAPSGCFYDSGNPAPRDQAMVSATFGSLQEICNSSWSSALQEAGKTAFGYPLRFPLTTVPAPSGVSVTVNGTAVPQNNAIWTYDSLTNAVIFTPLYAPAPGDTVVISYSVACLP